MPSNPGGVDHPVPSERARDLVRGGFDPHVHVVPDFAPRRITDLELASRCEAVGLAGFGLKSHYTATVERAAVVSAAHPGIRALGTIALNHAVGGLNATAVEVAARQSARTVWLPTVSAPGEYGEVQHRDRRPGSEPGRGRGGSRARLPPSHGLRAWSPEALERRVAMVQSTGLGVGWTEEDRGHEDRGRGPSYRFADPDGHLFELYHECERYTPPPT